MPALNIDFTDAELAQLRERAKRQGVSMRALAHDSVVRCNTRDEENSLIGAAFVRTRAISADLLQRLAGE
jgi:hypothetical protein